MSRFVSFVSLLFFSVLFANDVAEYRIVANNEGFEPDVIYVDAGKRFRIIVENHSNSPMEFEMTNPIKELVLAPGKSGTIGMRPLSPGEYKFFNDFNPSGKQGKIISRANSK